MKTTYKVAAATGFRGYQQGDELDADPDDPAVKRALERGSIKKTTNKKPKEEEVDNG